jgi:nitrate reductase gamma subunit
MHLIVSLIAVLALVAVTWVGVDSAGLHALFGIGLPYLAILAFLVGVVWKIVSWARSPVPFQITTTCGQQKTLSWIPSSYVENPHTAKGVILRMALEVLAFRSLFRNTAMSIAEGRAVQGPTKWLWLGAIAFHYTFLVIFLRHLRFFSEPVPQLILWVQNLDGLMQVGVPVVYASTAIFLGAVTYLLARRLFIPQVRFISLAADYFPLFLLLGIGTTGAWMRHLEKTDITAVKELGMGLLSFSPQASSDIHWLFYAHLTLVSVLLLYFPFSKLMHMGGVFLSPTRNMTGNTREVRHINPWNPEVEVHSYAEYLEEFRDKMEMVDIPIDPIPDAPKEN